MAKVLFDVDDGRKVVALIAQRGDVGTAVKRRNLLDEAGLSGFSTKLTPDTTAEHFGTELVRVLEDHGTLDTTGEPALVALLRVLREKVEGQEAERAFVDRLLRPYPALPDALTPAQAKDVVALRLRLLACRLDDGDLPPDVLADAYRRSLPAGPALGTGVDGSGRALPVGIHAIVADLADFPAANRDGAASHPLLAFALLVAKAIEASRPDEAARVFKWVDEAMPRWAPHATAASLDAAAGLHRAPGRSAETRLVVRVMPLDGDPAMFKKPRRDWRVQFDAFIGPYGAAVRRCRDAADGPPVTVDDLPGEIERLVDGLAATYERPDWIEFFLPAALMSLRTDQWCCRLPFEEEGRLGSEHKVVVRSWDRAFIPTHLNYIRRDWEARWARLAQDASADVEADHVRWVDAAPDPVAGSRGLREDLKASPGATCVAFAFDPVDPEAAFDHVKAIISAGVPVALWPRRSAHTTGGATQRGALAEVLRGAGAEHAGPGPRPHLCDAVKHARLAGSRCAGDHLAQHLTLMWDDPTDLGALAPLRAPAEGGA